MSSPRQSLNRRTFLKTGAAATAAFSAELSRFGTRAYASGSDALRVGLIGCGGRGMGAARDAVAGSEGIRIVAMGDLFEDRLTRARGLLTDALGEAVDVPDDRAFHGFDNYKSVIDSGVDLVLLTTPPGFRPLHFRYAVEHGKHVFMEKPISVDLTGTRSVLESGEIARARGLSVVAGTQYRRQPSFYEAIDRIHDGIIGDVLGAQVFYNTGRIWQIPRQAHMSDMEWQCRNWYYFTWLSGDHIVEQFVHNIDTVHWVFGGPPAQCIATGGRQQRVGPEFGHIYDHFAVDYEYAGGAKVLAMCRQMEGCTNLVTNRIVGTTGVADIHPSNSVIISHRGQELFRAPESGNNPYIQEHTDLVKSIREGSTVNETRQVSEATLMAIMGREAAYTGQRITWEELLEANLDLGPTSFEFGPAPFAPVPVPGVTALDRVEWPRVAGA